MPKDPPQVPSLKGPLQRTELRVFGSSAATGSQQPLRLVSFCRTFLRLLLRPQGPLGSCHHNLVIISVHSVSSTPWTFGGINPRTTVFHHIGWLRRHGYEAPRRCCCGRSIETDHLRNLQRKRLDPYRDTRNSVMIMHAFNDRALHRNKTPELRCVFLSYSP